MKTIKALSWVRDELHIQPTDDYFLTRLITLDTVSNHNRNPMRPARLFSSKNRSLHQEVIDSLKSGSGRIRIWFCAGDPGKPASNKRLINSSACCAIQN